MSHFFATQTKFYMKKIFAGLLFAATMSAFFTSCKKDDTDAGQVLSSITDTTGNSILVITYNSDNKPSRIANADATFDIFYADGKIVRRTQTQGGTVSVDSFFYDGNGRFSRIDNYDNNNDKTRSTVFAYNGDNTINAATVNYEGIGTADAIYEFTYTGSNLSTVKEQEKVLSTYRDKRLFEFLAFDSRINPVQKIIKDCFPDQFNLLIYMMASTNNFTSMKQTDYNTNNGNVTGTFPVTATYTYGSNNMPVDATVTLNGSTNRATYHYTNL
jgi:hypothetical protein